jgi:hypothetical protein
MRGLQYKNRIQSSERLATGLDVDILRTFTVQLCNRMPRVNDAFWELEAVKPGTVRIGNQRETPRPTKIERIHRQYGSEVHYGLC